MRAAQEGRTGVTVTLIREPGQEYQVSTGLAPLEKVASRERLFPGEWRNASGTDVTPAFHRYVSPLVGFIPHYVHFQAPSQSRSGER